MQVNADEGARDDCRIMIDLTSKPLAGKKGVVLGIANEHSNVTGPVKAALESSVRYLAHELGPKGIRVHAISPGPVKTRAASGIDHFDDLLDRAAQRARARRLVSIEDVGVATAVLATDNAKLITGETVYVDGGYHILG